MNMLHNMKLITSIGEMETKVTNIQIQLQG